KLDSVALSFGRLMIVLTFLVFLIADHYFLRRQNTVEDVYAVIIFSLIGAVVLTMFENMVMFFIGLEIMSVSLYILTGSKKTSSRSNEAAMKYFLMGTFSTGILLYGIALIYGASGSFDLSTIGTYVATNQDNLPLYFKTGIVMVTIALAFKIGAVPFHFWVPDVYHGAPTLVTTYMATVVKIAGVVAFYRLFSLSFLGISELWGGIISILAVFTIFVGNLSALYQTQVKRMLAYSSVAHTGYLMLGLVAFNDASASTLFYYSVAYGVSTIGTFAALMLVREKFQEGTFGAFEGLAKKNGFLSFVLSISLLSLTGIPPLAGFMAKYFIFAQAIEQGFWWLSIAAILGTAISVVYYFKMIIGMYFREPKDEVVHLTTRSKALLIVLTILIISVGLFPSIIINLI
ncbi:MAG TPA: NADH-quinone oxidoreductase subunit N, partial [Bacteroidales bacterium]|nr:NADH-quinone oxidoreductase subunit N [Bacteroidales bacterium]